MKAIILRKLRENAGVVSGQRLSRELGISRVAVWKHIQKLLQAGYDIQSGPKGYRLLNSPDAPFPWEFPEREANIHYFRETGSTMTVARDLARKNCPSLTVVVAEKQDNGRGRMDRQWESNAGGLYFTLVLRPEVPLPQGALIPFTASLALSQTLREVCDLDAKLKWPNDILVNGKKVCGMLSEMEAQEDRVAYINIGIGVNLNNSPSAKLPAASSVRMLTGKPHSRKDFLAAYLDRMEEKLEHWDPSKVIAEWKTHTATLGREVRVVSRTGVTEGTAVDIDPGGALVVKTADGTLKKVYYGDCFHNP